MKKILSLIIILALINGCKKDDATPPEENTSLSGKLKYLVYHDVEPADTIVFLYDNGGRIATMQWKYSSENTRAIYTFARNSSGKIVKFRYQEPDYDYDEVINYSIGNDGKYISAQITKVDAGNTENSSESYTYTGNLLTKIERTASYPDSDAKLEFTYDSRGNVILCEKRYESWSIIVTEELTYDNKINPITSLDAPFALDAPFDLGGSFYGINNILTKESTDDTHSYTTTFLYTYNDSDKPTSIIVSSTDIGSPSTFTIQYFYY